MKEKLLDMRVLDLLSLTYGLGQFIYLFVYEVTYIKKKINK